MTTTDDADVYFRAAIVTSEHPAKPLEGTVVAISTTNEMGIDEPLLGELVQQANARFDIDSYANDLRLGTIYFRDSNRDFVGVRWEESPRVYEHGDFDELVDTIPDDLARMNPEN